MPRWLLLALLAVLSGCASPRVQTESPQRPQPVATVNQWGEGWRESVSPEGYLVYEYVGMLADHIAVTQPETL